MGFPTRPEGYGAPKVLSSESFAARIEQEISGLHAIAEDLDAVANRVYGPVPENAVAGNIQPVPSSLIEKVGELSIVRERISSAVLRLTSGL